MKTIKLYGHLGKQFGKVHKYYVNTPIEATQLLSANYKGFREALMDFNGGYRVVVGKEDVCVDDLNNPFGSEVIKIVPIVSGQGGGLVNIIMGATLMYFSGGFGSSVVAEMSTMEGMTLEGMNMAVTIQGYAASALSNLGMSMILGGISQMLYVAPPPPARQAVSGAFDGAVNTTRQGVPIAVGYGELIVGSAVISAGLTSVSVPV